MEKRKYNIPIFIPHLGCPNSCAFCNQKKITGKETEVTPSDVRGLIEKSLATVKKDSEVEVAFFGGSFTGLEKGLQVEFLKVAGEFFPDISGIRLSTRADYIDEEEIKLLKEYRVTAVELGVQSTDEEVLEKNLRGHSFDTVKKAAKLLTENGFELGLQMMIGMYGSNFEKDIKTEKDIISLNPKTTRIYPCVILKDTMLEDLYKKGEYVPYTVEEAAYCAKEISLLFEANNVTILRMGLHSSEELDSDAIVKGPYHPAFGEMVKSLIIRDRVEKEIIDAELKNCDLKVRIRKNEISQLMGQKKANCKYFLEKYNVKIVPETGE